jgi:predicted MFS family arabinose efflux permease
MTIDHRGRPDYPPVPAQLATELDCPDATPAEPADRWLAVWSIALGSFVLVFSELIPVGLLPDIGGHLGVSIGVAGLMIVTPAVVAAISAPLLTLGSARIERRQILRAFSVLVLVSDLVAAATPNFPIMLVARAVLGVCIGGFWVFGSGAAMAIVRAEARSTAVALVSSGIFVATVTALPVAAFIGNVTTWRVAFLVAAALAALAILVQITALPRLGTGNRVLPRNLFTVVKLRTSRIGLVAAGAIFFADFAAYTYLNPLLRSRAGLSGNQITVVLLGFGLAGAVTNFTAGVTVKRHLRATFIASGVMIALSLLLMALVSDVRPATVILVFAWGAGFGGVPVVAQTWMAQSMPGNVEGGLALFVSTLQGSLAAGSLAGGLIFNAYGTTAPLVLAAAVAGLGTLVLLGPAAAAITSVPAKLK